MKTLPLIHGANGVLGFIGVILFATAIFGDSNNPVFGLTKGDALLCSGIIILIAIWLQLVTIYHLLEKKVEA